MLALHRPSPPSPPTAAVNVDVSPERRLLTILQQSAARPVGRSALAQAGIQDPAKAIFELERAGYRIERTYAEADDGGRRFVGYRLCRDIEH